MRPPIALFTLAVVLVAERSFGAERDRTPLTAALENAPVLSTPDLSSTPPQPEATAAPTPGPAAAPGNPLWSIPLRALSATRDRPLFSPSRRPPAPVIADAPAPAPAMPVAVRPAEPEPPPLALVGTVVSAEKRVAILFNLTTRQVTQVHEGAEESGWRVQLVSPRSAVVVKGGVSVTLDLPKPGEASVIGP